MLYSTQDLRTSVQGMISQIMYTKGFNLESQLTKDEQVEVLKTVSNVTKENDIVKLPEFDYKAFGKQSFQQFMIFVSNKITMSHFNQDAFNGDLVNKEVAKSLSLVTGKPIRTEESSSLEENLEIMNSFFNNIGQKAVELTEEMNKCKDYKEGCALLIDKMFEDNYKYYKVFNKNKLIDVYSNICSKSKDLTEEDAFKMMLSDSSIVKDSFKDLFEKIAEKAKEDFDKHEKASKDDNKENDKEKSEEESKSIRELLNDNYSEAVKLFHSKLNKNGIGCTFKVAKIILRDFKELANFPEEIAFGMIITLVQTRGIEYYQEIAKAEQEKAQQEKAKKEEEKANQDKDNKENDKQQDEEKSEDKTEEESEKEETSDDKFPVIEEDLSKDDNRQEEGSKLSYEEIRFNFKDGDKDKIKAFLNVSTKTDTKAGIRKFINAKCEKYNKAFNYENAEDVPVYMIKNVKDLSNEFSFIKDVDESGLLNNNKITTFLANKFEEELKTLDKSKATLKELQDLADKTKVVDSMILDEYTRK